MSITTLLTDGRELYSVEEAAHIIGLNPRTLRGLEYAGRIHAVRIGKRVMFPRATLETIISEGVK